ncbi:MAG: hypothetical protein H7249_19645 [Chitinophagaceae bacterium]|nr:hypothetical protein [Oligoflexus sp.]
MSFKILIIMTFLLGSVNARANEPAHGSAAGAAVAARVTDKYAHSWIAFPALTLKSLSGEPLAPRIAIKGRVLITVFVASWCIPCQQLMSDFKRIALQYENAYTDVIFVFAHDTAPDAQAFASFHKVTPSSFLGTAKVLEDFHQPDLPSIYASDRYGWLVYRKLNAKIDDVKELEGFLELHNSF